MNENENNVLMNAEEAPAEIAVEAPAEIAVEAPAEVAVEAPAEVAAETPAEAAVEAPAEIAVEAPAEVAVEAPAEAAVEAPAKKKRKGLKIAILVIVLIIAFLAFGAVSFVLGQNSDFDLLKLIPSFSKTEVPAEPADFIGLWESDEHKFYASAGNIIELDGVKYTYKWEDEIITLKNADGEEIVIGCKRTSNRIKLWKDGNKSDSVYLRRVTRNKPEEICGAWTYGETVISFSDMGTADIYGNSYTYTADEYEITCKNGKKTEYMFYTVDGEYLYLWQPGESEKKLCFIRQDSLIPQLMGTWINENGYEYIVIYMDGKVEMCDISGFTNDDYQDVLVSYIEDGKMVMEYSGLSFKLDIKVEGNYMENIYLDEVMAKYYRVSDKTDLSAGDVEFLWSVYEEDENA